MTIKCPFCAEEIQEDALKCRYCKEWINQPEAIAKAPDIHVETKTDPTTLAERADTAAIDPTAGTVPLDTQEPPADPAKASTSGNSDSHYRRNEKNKFDTVNLRFNGDTSSMDRDDKSKLHEQYTKQVFRTQLSKLYSIRPTTEDSNPMTIKCPFCAEEIQAEAKKCKHCGEWIKQPTTKPATTPKPYDPNKEIVGGCGQMGAGCGMLIFLPIIVGFIALLLKGCS